MNECEYYDPEIFTRTPQSVAFDLAGSNVDNLERFMDLVECEAQKLLILKAKNNFTTWYQHKLIAEENESR